MQVTPPSQGQPPQGQAPKAPGGQPQAGGAEQAIQMVQKGFMMLGKMIQAAGSQLDPQDVKLFQVAVKATDDFFQALLSPSQAPQQQGPAPKQAQAPMPMNANAGARPAPQY